MPGTSDAMDTIWDVIIVGQGLAGTALAWRLVEANRTVLLIDADDAVTSSKIAAGLMTPITGRRLHPSWRCDEFLPIARAFYKRVEARSKTRFFYDRTAIRLFQSDKEGALWAARREKPAVVAHLLSADPAELIAPAIADTSGGGFVMQAAQLDVPAYLGASRNALPFEAHRLDWKRDVHFSRDTVTVAGRKARLVISCEGAAANGNPWFSSVPFRPARGDILTLRFAEPLRPQTLHCGVWLAPTGDPQIFKAGSTYDRNNLHQEPSADGRRQIEDKLRRFMRMPYEVIDHKVALRPIVFQSRAIVGLHPEQDRLGYFNGLGSKGSMHAPWYAERFAALITHGVPLPDHIDLRRSPLVHAARH
ncbi:MAG: FAD-binding oxidoreductase [Hyphomicrobiales bacterium]|nr:FAD-binding oxidoreductase [Hyphomicrobiales bacterium]